MRVLKPIDLSFTSFQDFLYWFLEKAIPQRLHVHLISSQSVGAQEVCLYTQGDRFFLTALEEIHLHPFELSFEWNEQYSWRKPSDPWNELISDQPVAGERVTLKWTPEGFIPGRTNTISSLSLEDSAFRFFQAVYHYQTIFTLGDQEVSLGTIKGILFTLVTIGQLNVEWNIDEVIKAAVAPLIAETDLTKLSPADVVLLYEAGYEVVCSPPNATILSHPLVQSIMEAVEGSGGTIGGLNIVFYDENYPLN